MRVGDTDIGEPEMLSQMVIVRRSLQTIFSRILGGLTYANVVATLALFIGLGGASYAAITLPNGSVGTKQLRAKAVNLGALSFPLGATGITDNKVVDLTKGGCNGGGFSGTTAPDCIPLPRGGPTPGREVHVLLRSAGRLLISAIVGLKNEGSPSTTADITLGLIVDRSRVAESQITTTGGQIVQVPIQTLVNLSAGSHTAGLAVHAEYGSSGPGDVLVTATSIIASAFPPFKKSGH
jgi:hypothetical protein